MNFKNNPAAAATTPRQLTELKYKRSRYNLLLVLLFTVINLFTVTFGGSYFLFSATIPMLFPLGCAGIAADPEFMAEMGLAAEDATTLMIVGLVIGIVLVIPYLLCWIFSKKRVGWLVAALVLFSIDCLLLLVSFDISVILDLLFHGIVMFYLITGVINGFKLKDMPEDEPLPAFGTEAPADAPAADSFNTFNEADFAYTAEPAETTESTEDTGASTEE